MEAQELQERLKKILEQNAHPDTCMGTMPEDLQEAFNRFVKAYSCSEALRAMLAMLEVKSIEPVLSGTLAQGFWLGHDYALEHGQLRGN